MVFSGLTFGERPTNKNHQPKAPCPKTPPGSLHDARDGVSQLQHLLDTPSVGVFGERQAKHKGESAISLLNVVKRKMKHYVIICGFFVCRSLAFLLSKALAGTPHEHPVLPNRLPQGLRALG